MKRYRKVSAAETKFNNLEDGAFNDLVSKAHRVGYSMTVDDNMNISTTADSDENNMPEITITPYEEDGVYYLNATLVFPKLTTEDSQYYDDIAYWTGKWAKVGEFISSVTSFSYDPAEWEED